MKYLGATLLLIIGVLVTAVAALALAPGRWLADQVEPVVSSSLGVPVTLDSLDLNIFSMKPGAMLHGLAIDLPEGEPLLDVDALTARVDLAPLLTGELVIDSLVLGKSSIELERDKQGRLNWAPVIDSLAGEQSAQPPEPSEPSSTSDEPLRLPVLRRIQIDALTLRGSDAVTGHEAELQIDAAGSTAYPAQPTDVRMQGQVNAVPVDIDMTLGSLAGTALPPEQLDLDVDGKLGNNRLAIDGLINGLADAAQAGVDLDFDLDLAAIADLAALARIEIPAVPPLALAGEAQRDGSEIVFKRLDARLGASDLGGDVRVDTATQPLTLYANLVSQKLVLEDISNALDKTSEKSAVDEQGSEEPDKPNARLLPDEPIDFAALTDIFNGAVAYEARLIESADGPLESLNVRAEIEDEQMKLLPATVGVAGGELVLELTIEAGAKPVSTLVETRVSNIDLKAVMRQLGIDDDSFGVIGGRGKFWLEGDSVAQMAASIDGGLFLLMTGGKVDALLSELAGIDLVETVTLLVDPGKTLTPIDCGYLDLHAKEGVASINRLVIDTRDTVFQGDGSIDFNDESMDLIVEPQPKDVSVLAASTAMNIGGTLASPTVKPGRELVGKALAAATLAAVAAPAAAILPFIQPPSGEDSQYCEGLVKAIDEAR